MRMPAYRWAHVAFVLCAVLCLVTFATLRDFATVAWIGLYVSLGVILATDPLYRAREQKAVRLIAGFTVATVGAVLLMRIVPQVAYAPYCEGYFYWLNAMCWL
jgi:hypothetical protein